MARPLWNGVISFGLLNIPISLQSAERRVDLHFRMIDNRSQKPIRYERVNAETGEEVPWKDIVQAFEYKKGNYVVLSKEDIAAAAPHGKESIDIDAFVDRDAISPMYFEKPYYLIPGKKAEKGYALLRTILKTTHRAGIGYVIIRTRRYLAAVLVEGEALVLNLLRFQQEVVGAEDFSFPPDDLRALRISSREIEMAKQLVDSMTVKWDVASYTDDYRETLMKIVEKRLGSKRGLIQEVPEEPEVDTATNVVDFMALLKQSLQKKGGSRGEKAAEKKSAEFKSSEEPKTKARRAQPKSAKTPAKSTPKKAQPRTTKKSA
jgi:DNA end-binding protein Ku